MKNELRRHKKSDRVKWCIAFAAILLLAAGLTLICLQLFTPYKPSNGFKKTEADARVAVTSGVKLAATAKLPAEISAHSAVTSDEDYTAEYADYVSIHNNQGISMSVGFYVAGCLPMGKLIWVPKVSPIAGYDVQSIICAATKYVAEQDLLESQYATDNYVGVRFSQLYSEAMADITYNLTPKPSKPLPSTPSKEGYTFVGWYYDEALTQLYDGAPIYEDITFYAKFEINRYAVTFDSVGGSACESVMVDWNTSPTLPTPTRTGYIFVGWFDGDTQYTDAPVKENKTLTAHWEIMTFTVTFMSDGAVYKQITVDYGTSLVDVVEQANAQNLQVLSVRTQSGQTIQNTVTDNLEVQTQIMTGADKIKNEIKQNWKTIAIAAGSVVAFIVVISMLAALTKKPRKARR